MDKLLEGLRSFRQDVYPRHEQTFRKLADRQHPFAMLITCADSRIDPAMVLQCDPGDIFVCRNAGNIVPAYNGHADGVAATVEYAVDVLGIRNIIVCGHSDCGAMKATLRPGATRHLPATARWLKNVAPAQRIAASRKLVKPEDQVKDLAQQNVLAQITNLTTHPCIAAGLETGKVDLFGWYYEIPTGSLFCYEPDSRQFARFDGTLPPAIAERRRMHAGAAA